MSIAAIGQNVRFLRAVRWVQAVGFLVAAADLVRYLLEGHAASAVLATVLAVFWALLFCVQTKLIHRNEALQRPRPDYASIARMEREVYGCAFGHEGTPTVPAPRWDGRSTHPDTTEPATRDQYLAWLEGYIKRGGKPTHFRDEPFSQAGIRYASSRVVVDSDYEYGSSLRHIIVARNATTGRTNPSTGFDGWAHSHMYFMHGYRTNRPEVVEVYSDPEFDAIRERFAAPSQCRGCGYPRTTARFYCPNCYRQYRQQGKVT